MCTKEETGCLGFGEVDTTDGRLKKIWLGSTTFSGSTCDPLNNAKGKKGAIGALLRFLPDTTDPITGERLADITPGSLINGWYYGYSTWATDNPCASDEKLKPIGAAFSKAAKHIAAIE